VRGYSPLDASLILVPGYLVTGLVGPLGGRITDKVGPVLPTTVGLAIEAVALLVYAQLGLTTSVWIVALAAVLNGIGGGAFFPANTTAIMRAVPPEQCGVGSGTLRTFGNVGMVFSFSVAVLVAGRAIPHRLAFAIFVGSTHLTHQLAGAFTDGLHAAFYTSIGFMALAALLSATNVVHFRRRRAGVSPLEHLEPAEVPGSD